MLKSCMGISETNFGVPEIEKSNEKFPWGLNFRTFLYACVWGRNYCMVVIVIKSKMLDGWLQNGINLCREGVDM